MIELGPDDAWVLLSYAIFNAGTGEDDWPNIEDCARRGALAPGGTLHGDRHGYDLADGGFFRSAARARSRALDVAQLRVPLAGVPGR